MPDWGIVRVPTYGAKIAKIGTRDGDGTYSNIIQVGAIQLFNMQVVVQHDELEGDDIVVDEVTQPKKGKGKLRIGGMTQEAVKVFTGQTLSSSGSTPNQLTRMRVTAKKLGYFGFVGMSEGSDGIGARTGFCPKCKITSDFDIFGGEGNKYRTTDIDIDLLFDDTYTITGVNEIQTVTITGTPTGGTFTLTFSGATTSAIAYNASSATVLAALIALATIGTGNVTVSGSAGGPYTVTFVNDLAAADVNLLTATGSLTGGTAPAVAIVESTPGVAASEILIDIVDWETKPTVLTLPPIG